jgi:site-specific DNA-cytosine methylase
MQITDISWFTKAKRASSNNDYETWNSGGGIPTLNAFDVGDTRAVVLIIDGTRVDDVRVTDSEIVPTVISRWGTGGGNVPAIAFDTYNQTTSEVSQTIKAHSANNENIGAVAYSVREDAKANNFSATETDTALTLQSHQPSPQSHHAQLFVAEPTTVRRLTPVECERLQGFPDNWTEGQADSNRYKQMGNAVAVPVVSWIVERLVANA